MPPVIASELTPLLAQWNQGDSPALDRVVSQVYNDLKRIAHARIANEQPGRTLQTTGLVHEAWLRLVRIRGVDWQDRNHFLSMASRVMRRILVEHARRRNAQKRGAGEDTTLKEEHVFVTPEQADTVLELDEAIQRLEAEHPRPAQAVELHYFGGLSQQEAAGVLGVSQPTVARDLRFALAWLGRELRP